MPRNQTKELAQWFVKEICNRPWTPADWGGAHMAHAKKLLKLYTMEDIRGCAVALHEGDMEFEGWQDGWDLNYLTTLLKGEPPFIEQYLTPPDPPAVYMITAYDEWVRTYGRRAMERDIWGGVYQPINEPHRLDDHEIALLLGEEAAQASLIAKAGFVLEGV